MIRQIAPTFLALLCVLAMNAPTAAQAYSGQELAGKARVTLAQAREIALKAAPGTITDQELEREPAAAGCAIRSTSCEITRQSKSASMPRPARSWRTRSRGRTPTSGSALRQFPVTPL